jgi:FlaA1/EpsC-like NDP-sugar epimerase
MITGAGGSIGSELARQVASFSPAKLILFERNENNLFMIQWELKGQDKNLKLVSVIGDILDPHILEKVMDQEKPDVIYHAAAYKHVPMMEAHPVEAIRNNVQGTLNVAQIAVRFGVEKFVLISTDKAVRPTNIMGRTKRVAEKLMTALGKTQKKTRFVSVRFGNVMGSTGSVIPLFTKQIDRGGPVTVTHPDAMRYFMTITEAVQLVMQAAAMGQGGELYILEMGKQIRILDLARNLIRLSGLEPDRDIELVFTGLRPGEKLSEALYDTDEGIEPTSHEKIRWVHQDPNTESSKFLEKVIPMIKAANNGQEEKALKLLIPLSNGYPPDAKVAPVKTLDD